MGLLRARSATLEQGDCGELDREKRNERREGEREGDALTRMGNTPDQEKAHEGDDARHGGGIVAGKDVEQSGHGASTFHRAVYRRIAPAAQV